jgi:Protein of unknwon function (DUF3310)
MNQINQIDQPLHYTNSENVECIEAIQAALGNQAFIDYCRGNAMKYMWRARLKDSLANNVRKAQYYLAKILEVIK